MKLINFLVNYVWLTIIAITRPIFFVWIVINTSQIIDARYVRIKAKPCYNSIAAKSFWSTSHCHWRYWGTAIFIRKLVVDLTNTTNLVATLRSVISVADVWWIIGAIVASRWVIRLIIDSNDAGWTSNRRWSFWSKIGWRFVWPTTVRIAIAGLFWIRRLSSNRLAPRIVKPLDSIVDCEYPSHSK